MDKVIINVGYQHYIMSTEDALTVARILNNAEKYQTKGYGEDRAYYVWQDDKIVVSQLELITDTIYRVAKLAGQPPKE